MLSFNPLQSVYKHTLTKTGLNLRFSGGFMYAKSMISYTTDKSLYGTYFIPLFRA